MANKDENGDSSLDAYIVKIISELGFGRAQIINYAVITYVVFFISHDDGSFVFTTLDTSYRCRVVECESNWAELEPAWLRNAIPYINDRPHKCKRYALQDKYHQAPPLDSGSCPASIFNQTKYEKCTSWIYGDNYSIIREFNIPCEDWKRSLVATISCLGQFFSLALTGILADKYGRRNTIIYFTSISGLIGLAQSFSPEYWSFLTLECLKIVFSSGAGVTAFILGIEMIEERKRITGSGFLELCAPLGLAMTGLTAWLLPNWRSYLIATSLPLLTLIFSYFFLMESIPWMISRGNIKGAILTIKNIAKTNNVVISDQVQTYLDWLETKQLENGGSLSKSTREKAVSKVLLVRLSKCVTCWIGISSVYFGLSIHSVSMDFTPNPYLQYTLTSLVDIPACIAFLFVVKWVGRKHAMFYSVLACGASCIIVSLVPLQYSALSFTIYLIAKFFIALTCGVNFLFTSEMYPTEYRNTYLSVCTMAASIGAAIVPQALLLTKIDPSFPLMVFTAICMGVGILVLTLPNTKTLPQSLSDAENLH